MGGSVRNLAVKRRAASRGVPVCPKTADYKNYIVLVEKCRCKEGLTIPEVFVCVGAVIFLTEATLSEAEAGGSLES